MFKASLIRALLPLTLLAASPAMAHVSSCCCKQTVKEPSGAIQTSVFRVQVMAFTQCGDSSKKSSCEGHGFTNVTKQDPLFGQCKAAPIKSWTK